MLWDFFCDTNISLPILGRSPLKEEIRSGPCQQKGEQGSDDAITKHPMAANAQEALSQQQLDLLQAEPQGGKSSDLQGCGSAFSFYH